MAERRWGRVTVEGWIEEDLGEWRVVTAKTGSAGIVAVAYKIPAGASVEFLPEPVTFKDGDALRYPGGTVYNRVRGRWHQGADSVALSYSDGWASEAVRSGSAVKLVPEANGG